MPKTKSKTRSRAKTRTVGLAERKARLAEAARLAQIFIDGDLVGRLLTEQGHLWTSGDDIDYHHEPFIALKKVLLRLEQTPADGVPVYVNVWRQRPDDGAKGEPLVAGMKVSHFGRAVVQMPQALRAAILTERVASQAHAGGSVSVFAPLYDSLHHVAGAVEVFDDPPA